MNIGGFQKTSFIDFPDKISCVIYTQGCNWRCPWCHNPSLVYPSKFSETVPEQTIFEFLKDRVGKIEGVVITGGEPTLQSDLPEFIQKCRNSGYSIKLDTNGSNPEVLEKLLKAAVIDYVAMDLKGPFAKYPELTGVHVNTEAINQSVELLKEYNVDHELRTTIHPEFHHPDDVRAMARERLHDCRNYTLQRFKQQGQGLDSASESKMEEIIQAFLAEQNRDLQKTVISVKE